MEKATPKNYRLSQLPLAKVASKTLDNAVKILLDKANATKARKSKYVTNYGLVGPRKQALTFNEVCHARVGSSIISINGGTAHYKGEQRVEYRKSEADGRYYYMYYNDVTKQWQKERCVLTKNFSPKAQARYLVNWSNTRLKEQYEKPQEKGKTNPVFTGRQLEAVRAYYDWLRNHSHFSRFFVGPRDTKTLLYRGHILDLSAPYFVIHFISVAWRMPGEYIELVEEWHTLVRRGIDPHLAFGLVQNVVGFGDQVMDAYTPRGHILMRESSITTIVRLCEGIVREASPNDKDSVFRRAQSFYATSCLEQFDATIYGYRADTSWRDVVAKERPEFVVEQAAKVDLFGRGEKRKLISAQPFQRVYDPGFAFLSSKMGEVCAQLRAQVST